MMYNDLKKYLMVYILFCFFNMNSQDIKNCPSCMTTLQQAQGYINQLEKTCKLLHDDVAKWMKLYSEEIANKAASIEKNMSWYMDYIAKFITLEQKVSATSHPKK